VSLLRWKAFGLRAGAAAATGILLGGFAVAATASASPDAGTLRAANVRAQQVFGELPYGRNPLGAQIASSGVDPATGAVTIAVANYSDQLAEKLRDRYGADLVVRPGELPKFARLRIPESEARLSREARLGKKDGATPLFEGLCGTQVYCSPTRGGVLLEGQVGGAYYHCTATILGTVSGSPANATLTAGHCFDLSSPVYAGRSNPDVGGYQLGTVSSRRFSGSVDAEAIRWSTGNTAYNYLNNCVYIYSSDCRRITGGGGGSVGMAVQKSGITTGVTSGTLTRLNVSVNIADENGNVTPLTNQFETTACVIPGDSGGPLYSGGLLLGISSSVGGLDSSGNCTANTRSYFSTINASIQAVGFSARYTP
jgi:streptogrisin D